MMNDDFYVTGVSTMDQVVIEEKFACEKTTQEHMADYLESIKAIEDCIKPYQEQKRDLKTEYVENGWLTKEEISLAVKAYRLVKNNLDELGELLDMVDQLRGKV